MEKLEKVEGGVATVERFLVTLGLALAFAAVLIQVARRTFSLLWIPDLYELALVGSASMTFLCIGLLTFTHGHITIDVADFIRGARLRLVVSTACSIAVLLFLGVFGKLAIDLVVFAIRSGSRTVQLGIPLLIPYGALAVGLALALFHTVMNALRARHAPDREHVDDSDSALGEEGGAS